MQQTHTGICHDSFLFSLLPFFRQNGMMLLACSHRAFFSVLSCQKEVSALLTYTLSSAGPAPLYEQLVSCLREDILSGRLPPGSHLPSKRSFAGNLGVSSITVEAAYSRLMDEGYVFLSRSAVISLHSLFIPIRYILSHTLRTSTFPGMRNHILSISPVTVHRLSAFLSRYGPICFGRLSMTRVPSC